MRTRWMLPVPGQWTRFTPDVFAVTTAPCIRIRMRTRCGSAVNASFEVVVFDLDLREVSARIPLPNGGSTHSGAFVTYPDGWNEPGVTVSDHNGLQGEALEMKRKLMSGEIGASSQASAVETPAEFQAGREVFDGVAGIGCKSCHGGFR